MKVFGYPPFLLPAEVSSPTTSREEDRDMNWDLKGTAVSAGEGIVYGVIDKVLKDQDALATPAPRTQPFKTWSDYFRAFTALLSAGIEAGMPKYSNYAKPVTGASFAFLTQSVWAYINSRSTGGRVTYVPQRTGDTAHARAVAAAAARAFAQEGVSGDEIVV